MSDITKKFIPMVACLALVSLAVAGLRGSGTWLNVQALPWLLLFAPLLWLAHQKQRSTSTEEPLPATIWVLFAGLLLFLFSSAASVPRFFLLGWWPTDGASLLKPLLARWALLSLVCGLALLYLPRFRKFGLPLILLLAVLLSIFALYRETGFRPIYNDDHPSFMHRLWIFAQTFPRLFYYDPTWNGGRVATYLVASGTPAPALFLWPFLRWVPIETLYTPGLAWLYLVVAPLVAYFALRATGASRGAACCAAILALGTTWEFFKWVLHFGTLGATFTALFALPVGALLYRALVLHKQDPLTACGLVAASALFLMWPGYWVIGLALLPAIFFTVTSWNRRTIAFLAACTSLILLILLPLMVGVSTRTELASFAMQATLVSPHEEASVSQGWVELGDRLRGMNPLIIFFGLLGAPFLPRFRGRGFLCALLLGLAVFTGWSFLFPGGLAVERAFLPLSFLAIWPAALWCDELFRNPPTSIRIVPQAALAALLLVHGYSVSRYYGNQTDAPYRVLDDQTQGFIDWLIEKTEPDARILFGGMTVHAYGGGHVAALPIWTGREMVAADYYHFSPRMVEYFAPPRTFRTTDEDVRLYTEILNIGAIVGYDEPSILRFYRKYPEHYEEVGTYPGRLPKTLFRVRRDDASFFLQNSGVVRASINRIEVELDAPDEDAVIKYLYSPELRTDPGVELFPYPVRDLNLIGIRSGGRARVMIRHGRFW